MVGGQAENLLDRLPAGMRVVDLFVIGCVAAIGFTVSLFIASVAFDGSVELNGVNVKEAAKMGALLSFAAAVISIVAGKLTRVGSAQPGQRVDLSGLMFVADATMNLARPPARTAPPPSG